MLTAETLTSCYADPYHQPFPPGPYRCPLCEQRVSFRRASGYRARWVDPDNPPDVETRRAHFAHLPGHEDCSAALPPSQLRLDARRFLAEGFTDSGYWNRLEFPDRRNRRLIDLLVRVPDGRRVAVEIVDGTLPVDVLKMHLRQNYRTGLAATAWVVLLTPSNKDKHVAEQLRWLRNRYGHEPACIAHHDGLWISADDDLLRDFDLELVPGRYDNELFAHFT